MNKRTTTHGGLLAAAALLSLSACSESERPVATGKGNLRAVNAIVSSPEISFLVEERVQGNMAFKDTVSRRIDDLSYNVNFQTLLAGDTQTTRIATQFVDVAANTEYVFVLTGALASPTVLNLEYPERQWEGNETVFEGRALHLATSAAELDVYYAAPGTVPVPGDARGSIDYGELTPAFEAPAGDYELILTAKDDPATVLYRSRTVTQGAAASVLYGIFDPDPALTGNLNVRVMGSGGGAEVSDADSPPAVRLLHAAFATGNVDLYANDDFSAPVIADVPFAGLSSAADYSAGAVPTALTPAGDTGVLLLEEDLTVLAGTRNSLLLVGPPATLELLLFPDNPRPIETFGKLRVMQASANITEVDFYLFPAGGDVNEVSPRFPGFPFRLSSGYVNTVAGDYEMAVTLPGEKAIIAGPVALTLALGDVVEAVILDTQDPNLLDLIIYDRSAL